MDVEILENLYIVLILGGPLILGLLLTLFLNLSLRVYQGVYLLLGAVSLLAYYFLDLSIVPILTSLLIGEVIMLILLGGFGKAFSHRNYAVVLFSVGLFPWMINLGGSIIFLVFTAVLTPLYSHYKNLRGFKAIGEKFSDPLLAIKSMDEETLKTFRSEAVVNFSIPLLISLLFSYSSLVFLF